MVQILCIHTCKWKNDICRNYSKNGGWRECRRMVKGVNSSKNYYKCHSVPPRSMTIKDALWHFQLEFILIAYTLCYYVIVKPFIWQKIRDSLRAI
jgi:hypothetical protein